MGKKVLVIGTSNQAASINRSLAGFASTLLHDCESEQVDMRAYEMPLFGSDRHKEDGIPEKAMEFRNRLAEYDGIIISLAEHNGSYTAAFKNLIDWVSVLEGKVWQQKPVLLLSASPGPNGAIIVLRLAEDYFPYMGARVSGVFSLGNFFEKFDNDTGITDGEKLAELQEKVAAFETMVLTA
ncbi:MAG: NAD(P)H-dependent oxidoreductase [Flavobacteriales bacterium]|nr:NAD(P)H-dependent oxidoreductase [Flavobacteriales bacterium]